MTQDENSGEDRRPADEAEALLERTVRRMLKTPPKPQKDMRLGKPKGRKRREGAATPDGDGLTPESEV